MIDKMVSPNDLQEAWMRMELQKQGRSLHGQERSPEWTAEFAKLISQGQNYPVPSMPQLNEYHNNIQQFCRLTI